MVSLARKFELRREGKCPRCEQFVDVNSFRDELSRREFRIAGYCQTCQDKIYGV
ncbi:MAG: hypothetical protein WC365_01190 [Candidatus Babeliales bacterium]